MVRIVSQNFSPPRSRHSSGETDLDLAERTKSALSTLGRKRVDTPECESSSDSFWDSEFDLDHFDAHLSEVDSESADINGNDPGEKSDAQSKRKQRRRERNKISAQAYRQRRRHANVKEKEQLMALEFENKRLHKLVNSLEKKTEQAKQHLRGISVPMPDILSPVGEEPSNPDFFESQACAPQGATAQPSLPNPFIPPGKENESEPSPSLFPPQHPPLHSRKHPNLPLAFKNINNPSPENVPSLATHPTKIPSLPRNHNMNAPTSLPSQPHIFISTQALIATPVPPHENLNSAAAAAASSAAAAAPPTYVAVPLQRAAQCFSPANLNAISQGFTALTTSPSDREQQNSPENKWVGSGHGAVLGAAPPSSAPGVEWNGQQNGNLPSLSGNNAVFSIVKMEMCNNGNVNINSSTTTQENGGNLNLNHNHMMLSDNNGNQNNMNTMTMKAINPQVVSFKVNLNQAPSLHNNHQANSADLGSQQFGFVSLSSQAPSNNNPVGIDQPMRLHVQ